MQMNFVYCRDDISSIENYDKALADNFKGWRIHHRLETHDKWGRQREQEIPSKVLMFLGLYYFRPANELIWLSNSEHCSLHSNLRPHSKEQNAKISVANKGKKRSDEVKAKLSASHKGMKGKNHTDETKDKISAAMKGKRNVKGKHWELVDGHRVYY